MATVSAEANRLCDYCGQLFIASNRNWSQKFCSVRCARKKQMVNRYPPAPVRFANKIQRVSDASSCWVWLGRKHPDGYGLFRPTKFTNVLAHRYAYELYVEPIPDGFCVCHHCDNPICVRPDHLFLGTHQDNMDDRERKGRTKPPPPPIKFNDEVVSELRRKFVGRYGQLSELAREYGMTHTNVRQIVYFHTRRIGQRP